MLSLNYLKSSAQAASSYYQVVTRQKDDTPSQHIDYYCRKPGEWFGRTAKILGYKDAVTEKHFVNLIEGRSKSGHLLVEPGTNGKRRGGYDLTFSAPKSVSIMAELAANPELKQEIYEAHEQSVKTALAYPFQTVGGEEICPDLISKASALGWMLCCHHPFIDGNKRVSHAAIEAVYGLNGYTLEGEWFYWARIILDLAKGETERNTFTEIVRSRTSNCNEG